MMNGRRGVHLALTLCLVTIVLAVDAQHHAGAIGWPGARVIYNMTMHNNSGLWLSSADQFSTPVWDAYFAENTLPDCNGSHQGQYTYKHHTINDPAYLAMAVNETTNTADVILAHHQGTYTWKIVKKQGFILTAQDAAGETWCTFWKPFIDLTSGELRAQSISKAEWTKGSDGKVTQNDLTCFVKDFETAGCYPQGANKVHSVSMATWTCKNGNCATFAPLLEHEEDGE